MIKRKVIVTFLTLVGVMMGCVGSAGVPEQKVYPAPKMLLFSGGEIMKPAKVQLQGVDSLSVGMKNVLLTILAEKNIGVVAKEDGAKLTITLQRADKNNGDGRIVLERKHRDRSEGYAVLVRQNIGSDDIVIEGNDERGLFYGIQSLRGLLSGESIKNQYVEDYPDIPLRGIVEGFYGNPWSQADRLAQLKFYGEHRLNTYIYAPKDDPYHRAKWREPYPKQDIARMQELIQVARDNQVDFVFAISPGIDIKFKGLDGERDFKTLLAKLNSVYDMGIRSFAVYYDDIEDKSAVGQALVLNRLQKEFVQVKGDIKYLLTVPTEYFTLDMFDKSTGGVKSYTSGFVNTLDKKIKVMYTGPGVVTKEINEADIGKVSSLYGRKMAVWWNYPVNDYLLPKVALGPIYGLDRNIAKHSEAFLMNPMEHAELSKITLQTGSEYAWSPKEYDYDVAWHRAIELQYGDLAAAMKVFADHSSYMYKVWAECGRADAPKLREVMDRFWAKYDKGEPVNKEVKALKNEFKAMEVAHAKLMSGLPANILSECKPQLELFGKLAQYNLIAINMIEARQSGDMKLYLELKEKTARNKAAVENDPALISEKVARDFLYSCVSKIGDK